MQIHVELIAIAVILVASTESKPSGYNFYLSNYPDYKELAGTILPCPELYPSYDLYNTGLSPLHPAVIATDKSWISQLPTYNLYYGTSLFNVHHFPLTPVPPEKKAPKEMAKGKTTPPATTTMKPSKPMEGSLEKLDTKAAPKMEKKDPCLTKYDTGIDSVIVESI